MACAHAARRAQGGLELPVVTVSERVFCCLTITVPRTTTTLAGLDRTSRGDGERQTPLLSHDLHRQMSSHPALVDDRLRRPAVPAASGQCGSVPRPRSAATAQPSDAVLAVRSLSRAVPFERSSRAGDTSARVHKIHATGRPSSASGGAHPNRCSRRPLVHRRGRCACASLAERIGLAPISVIRSNLRKPACARE